jgi:hypothetical protein
MERFCTGVPRWLVLSVALAMFVAVPPETLARGPELCVWKHLFRLTACPACGSTRALAAFFHGRPGEALAFNRNVIITAPSLVGLLAWDALALLRKILTCVKMR